MLVGVHLREAVLWNIPNEEGKGDSLSREQRTAVMVIVWEVIKAAANALCAFWVFEWKYLLLILPDSGTQEHCGVPPFS